MPDFHVAFWRTSLAALAVTTSILASAGDARADAASVAYSLPCTGLVPAADEVLVFFDGNYKGACKRLKAGFYPHDGNLGLPNDKISSVRAGADVRLRAFWDDGYRGGWVVYTGDVSFLGNWNDEISSARVELASRPIDCSDLQPNEMALYRDLNFNGDCVILPWGRAYGNADGMGIADNSVSSARFGNVLPILWQGEDLKSNAFLANPFSAVNFQHCSAWHCMGDRLSSIDAR